MFTPQNYGNSARYYFGNYPGVVLVTPPARYLSGLSLTYNTLLGVSNLPTRKLNYYSGANQVPPNRLATAGVVFTGLWGKNKAAFPINSDWSTNAFIT
jgi:hypothetical protein